MKTLLLLALITFSEATHRRVRQAYRWAHHNPHADLLRLAFAAVFLFAARSLATRDVVRTLTCAEVNNRLIMTPGMGPLASPDKNLRRALKPSWPA